MMRKAIETASELTLAKAAALATKLFTKAVAAAASPVERKESAAGATVTDTTTAGRLEGSRIRLYWNLAAVSSKMCTSPKRAFTSVMLKPRTRACAAMAAFQHSVTVAVVGTNTIWMLTTARASTTTSTLIVPTRNTAALGKWIRREAITARSRTVEFPVMVKTLETVY